MSGLKTAKKGVITLIFDVMEKDLNKLAAEAHANAVEKGFWEGKPSNEHFLCLVISELMEAVEADRGSHRNRRANVDWFKKRVENSRICRGLDHEIPKERGYEVIYNETIKGSIEEELADAFIRLLDLAGANNYNLNRFCLQHVVTEYVGYPRF